MNQETIRLSPTTGLGLFAECPKCFWLHYNKGVHRPRGIFPSLPGGMDLVIKNYFDKYRGSLPPEIEDKVEGVLLPDVSLMNQWRNWRTGLEYRDEGRNAVLFGALDDCLISGDSLIPLDYKTRGSAPREGDSEKYYQTQLDTYALLLAENGNKTESFAYLIYYFPKEVKEQGQVLFEVKPVKIETDLARAKKRFERAVDLLRGPLPEKHSDCEYCSWISDRLGFE
jgi:CRISPR/Cas system-associated exonuclease Cas4 (RecB family)